MKIKSWKTALAGLLAVLPQLLIIFFPDKITEAQANGLSMLFVASGLVAAKDSNVTGVGDGAMTKKEIDKIDEQITASLDVNRIKPDKKDGN